MTFLQEFWFILVLAGITLAVIVYLVLTKQWGKLKMTAYALMLQAERIYSTEEGKKKMDDVFTAFYNRAIPDIFRPFVTEEWIRSKLQKWYKEAKVWIQKGRLKIT